MESNPNKTLADLSKLLDFGFLKETCIIENEDGSAYQFELKTLTPLEESIAQKAVDKKVKDEDELSAGVYTAIEFVSRSVTTVNGVALETHPAAAGDDDLMKKRSIIARLSEPVLLKLWDTYAKLKASASGSGTPEEDEAVKK